MPYRDTEKRRLCHAKWRERNRAKVNAYNRERYAADPTAQKRATLNWRKKNKARYNESCRIWMANNYARLYDPNTESGRARLKRENSKRRRYRAELKLQVLTHYGNGKLQCRWRGCRITDIDMLTLDHVNNDGTEHRRCYGSLAKAAHLYRHLRRDGFPDGYQTLCCNHQLKKELMRKRALYEEKS